MRTLSIAAVQTAPVAGDPDATLERLATSAAAVRETAPHAQVAVWPELHLPALSSLLAPSGAGTDELAVEVPGPLTQRLGEIAREHRLWLVPGSLYERTADGPVHNTVVVFSPEGELVARYRKIFPWEPHEGSAAGAEFVTFEIPGLCRVGLAVCYDGAFPETFRQLAWLGAEVILQPTLTTTADRDAELVMARANAIFNQLYVVSVNAAQPAGLGRSMVADPEGIVRAEAGEAEQLLTDVLDLDAVARVRKLGLAGVSRMWAQILRAGPAVHLPMYGGSVQPPPG